MYISSRFSKVIWFILLFSITLLYAEETHTIQEGETVYQLSRKYGIPVDVLLEVNKILDPNDIPAGQSLQIPKQIENQKTRTIFRHYTVLKGDTLYAIAIRNGISLEDLLSVNTDIDENIRVGQMLNIPDSLTDKELITQVANNKQEAENTTHPITNTITKKNRKSFSSFGSINARELMGNAQAVGKVSEAWPVSGEGYLLKGKLPGVLIEGLEDQVVYASNSGIVLYAALHSSFSNVVVIQGEDGIVYVYAGQKNLYIKQGDFIAKGSAIGVLGIMPTLQKPVLYFSLWEKNRFLDPRKKIVG